MTTFRVWAPRPERVELVVGSDGAGGAGTRPGAGGPHTPGRDPGSLPGDRGPGTPVRHPMRRQPGGWWQAEVADARPGTDVATDYGFLLDGEGPFPDPRSPFQPHGVHGLSRTVDHAGFAWTDAGWDAPPLDEAVIYELHVGTFTEAGSFDGVIERLDDLVALGITHLELMPVAEYPGRRGWGYDGVDLFAPHHAYGGPDGLKRLVDACHARGLAVLVDVVYNHLGPDGNYLARFGPYFSHRYLTPWGDAVNFDGPGSDEVRAYVVDNARMWLDDYHADGLRIDAVHAIFDQSAVHILEELATAVHDLGGRLGRRLVAIAESDLNDPRLVRDPELGGYGLDAQWNDDFRHALHVALTGESDGYHAQYTGLEDVAAALRRVFVYDRRYSAFRDRTHGRPVGDLPTTRFVGFLQNHDQVGNRALGERIGQLVSPEALRVGAALVLLGPFVPLLFAGEEWGATTPFQYFTDHEDESLAAAVREGRRAEFPGFMRDGMEIPDPQAPETFLRSRLDWSERERSPHAELLAWYRSLIALRASRPELREGARPRVRLDASTCVLEVDRARLRIIANAGPATRTAPLSPTPRGGWRVVLASSDGITLAGDRIELPGWSVTVLEGAG
jgi:maltooligosyltrehalose trehalohydrolase